MPQPTPIGAQFAHALAEKDVERVRGLFATNTDFRAMTPRRTWQAEDPAGVLEIVFGNWFEDSDRIDGLELLETDSFADRERVGYRFNITNPDGRFLVEQQAYLSTSDGDAERGSAITWMRVLCSGFRPLAA